MVTWKQATEDYEKKGAGSKSAGTTPPTPGMLSWDKAVSIYDKLSEEDYRSLGQKRSSRRQLEERWRMERNSVNDWIYRYNHIMEGVSAYDKERNVGFTRDASGGYGGRIESLIADYEGIKGFAEQYGFQDSQKYLDQLKQLQESIGQINDSFSQFEDDGEYDRYKAYMEDLEEKRNVDLDAYSRENAALENALNEYKNLSRWNQDARGTARMEAIRKQYGGLDEMEALLSQRQQYLTQAQRIQNQDADSKRFADIRNRDDFAENSGFDTGNQEIGYRYVNSDAAGRLDLEQQYGDPVRQFGNRAWDSLNEEEKQVYNYLMNTGDRDGAAHYLRHLEESLQYRKGEEADAAMDALVAENPKAKALRYAFMANAGYDQHLSGMRGMGNMIAGNGDYVPASSTQVASGLVREDLADDGWQLPEWLGGGSTGQMVGDLISTTANMAPSMAVGLINPNAGAAMMGASAAGSAYQEALNEGYSREQARKYGIAVGASETALGAALSGIKTLGGAVTNNVIESALKGVKSGIGRFLIEFGGSVASEALEEGIQEILTPVFSNHFLNTNEQVNWSEVAYSALLGGLTAGVLEGPAAVSTGRNGANSSDNVTSIFDNVSDFPNNGTKPAAAVSKMETVQQTSDIDSFARQFGTQAEAVKRNYLEGQDLQEYEVGFQTAYAMGLEGGKQEALTKVPYLSQSQREIAFSMGRDAAAAQKAAEPKKAAVTAKMTTEEGIQDVTIAEVVSMDDTTMTFRLEDGRTVTDNDLDFEKGQKLMSAAWELGMDVKTVNAIVTESAANTAADADQAAGIQQAHHYGQHGYTMEQLTKYGADAAALTDGQRKAAWEAGRQIYLKKAGAAPGVGMKVSGKTAGVWFDAGGGNVRAFDEADTSGLSETALAGARTAKVLQKLGIGRNYYFYESYVNSKGDRVYKDAQGVERIAPNGWYDPDGSIHIDLNAGAEGKGLTMYTLSHELTHFVEKWSPKKYQALADFLVANYAKAGNVDAMVAEKQAELSAGRGSEVSYEEAYSEFIADSMEAMLSDGNVLEKLQELKKTDKSLFDKIREFFDNLGKKIREIYKDLTPDSLEGQAVLQMKDQIDQIQQLFAEALVEAGENYQAAAEIGLEVDMDTESVSPAVLYSERTWKESDYVQERNKAAKEISKAIGVSEKKAKQYIDSVNGIAKMIAEDRTRLDYFSSPGRSSFIGNVEYGGSFDFSTLCKKRRLLTGTFTAIQKALPNTALTANEILDIRNRMKDAGLEVSCGLCYVEGSRANMGQFAKEFLRLYKQYYPDAWQPNMADVNTPDGIEWVRINHPECYEQYEYFWNHYGTLKTGDKNLFASQQKPKLYQLHTEYKGEILQKFKGDDNVEEKNLNGGIRLQSFSDFEIVHLIDTMQIIMDMSRVGLAGQAYTKVPDFAWALGDTGLKINLSLIAKGVDESGKLIFDNIEGMPIAEAMKLRDRYSANVGTILVAFNDAQLMAAMADDRVDFIIPFHRSQWKKSQYEAMGLPAKTKDYTFMQNEKFIKPQYHEYRGRMVKDKATNYMPNEYWDFSKSGKENAEAYLEMCARNNKRPKFYKLLQNNGDGSYSLKADGSTDGYWKLLIDFKMYDNEGNGSPQMPVRPDFNMEESARMMREYKGGHSSFPVAQGIVDAFVQEYKQDHPGRQFSEAQELSDSGIRYSIRQEAPPRKVGIAYKVFLAKDGELYPPMVANPNGEGTPVGVWLNADIGKAAPPSKTGRPQVQGGGKGTNSGKISLAFRPGWHLGDIPLAKQFAKLNPATGKKELFPANFVWAECEYAMDVDYQEEAMSYGYTENGKFRHSYAGLPKLPADGYYRYRTNPNPDTVPWVITGAMRVKRILTDAETDEICRINGVEPMARQGGPINLSDFGLQAGETEAKRLQDRSAGTSNRALLAGAFENLARNPDELESIRKYRENVKKMDAEEAKLQELRQQIREMTFVKGKRDDKKLQELRDEATKTANRIAVYDKRLLGLEAAAPIQQVLAREKEKVRKASDQKHRDAMKKYREETRAALEGKTSETEIMEREFIRLMKAYEAHASASAAKSKAYKDKIQTQKDTYREDMAIMEREFLRTMKAYEARERVVNKEWETEFRRLLREYDSAERNIGRLEKRLDAQRESVKQGILRRKDSAKRRELRTKIRKTVFELDKLLNRGDKKKNVKSGMTSMVDSVLKLADALFMDEYTNRDMLRNGVGVELTDAEEKLFREAQQILQQAESGAAMENMEFTSEVDAMEQLNKLDQKLSSKMAGLKDVFARERKRLYGTTVSDLLGKLADEYSRLSEAEDGAVRAAKDENVYAHLLQLKADVGGTTVRDMTLGQMKAVADAFTMVLTTVRNANKMFAKNLKFKRDTLAGMVMGEIGAAVKKVRKLIRPVKNAVDTFSWNNLKPVYAFERLGSETLRTLYQNIRDGQDVWSRDMQEADTFRREQYKKHNRKAWNLEKQHRFEFESGVVELSLEQIMSLYAYSRREQALDHLLKGGFVFSGSTEVMVKEHGIQRRYLKKDATAYNLTADELLQVIDTLTKEQKAFVEEMQTYLSDVMGGKGNEISLQMYGIKSYGEKNYFPIRSAGQYMERAKEDSFRKEQGQISIVNSGFTKSTTPKANNPITLDGFMNVWAEHVNEMSMYHGFALPMEDFRRVYNYSSPNMEVGNSQSVNAVIENAFGKAATGYIDQLYKDLNGGAVSDNRENLSKKLVGLHKKAAVFASASVVIQQPSAIVRAFALIDPRHFIGPKVDRKRHKLLWEEVKKYAPVAFVKEMGYFDTGMGRSAKDFLQAEEYSGIREKMAALFKDADYRDEILGKAPALADELAWCSIWEAVKRETKAKNPGMDVRSDAFLQIAGARFSEVIDKTQVYDSVLSRSANMRSKSGLMNMVTSFMAEPTTSINMLEDALRSGDRHQLKRTVGAVYGSVLLNSLLVSLVYAARDDDEDETYLEKYLSSVAVEMMDGINPITYYPFLRDIWSIGQGFDVERADMSLITDFADAAKNVISAGMKLRNAEEGEEAAAMEKFKDSLWSMTDTVASLTGLPVKNIRRDIDGARNLVKTIGTDLAGRKTTDLSLQDAVLADVMNSIPIGGLLYSKNKRDRLYGALVAGDAAYVQRLKAGYESDNAYHSAIKMALRDNDSRIWEAASAWNSGDMDTYLRIAKEIRGENRFEQDDIVLAIRAEANSMLESEGESDSTVKGYFTNEKFGVALSQNNTSMADIIRKDLIDTKVANGKTREEAARSVESAARSQLKELFEDGSITGAAAEKLLVRYGGYDQEEAADKVADWKFESEYGFTYSERGDAYKNGEISQAELRSILMDVGEKTREEADLQIQVYEWEAQGFEGATISAVRNYNEYCSGARVPKDVYLHIRKVANSTDNDVDASGKTIYYSAMKKIMAEIGGQYGLTATQKYAIARSLGWSDKNIEKYKTW